jgi:hypothetical protein
MNIKKIFRSDLSENKHKQDLMQKDIKVASMSTANI